MHASGGPATREVWDMLQCTHSLGALTVGVDVLLHGAELLGKVLDDVVVVKEGGERAVDNLGGHGGVGSDVGQEERGSKVLVLLFDFYVANVQEFYRNLTAEESL